MYSPCHYGWLNEDICSLPGGCQNCRKTHESAKGLEMRCRSVIMPFYKSVLPPPFEYSSRGQLSYLNEATNDRVRGQRRAVELIRGLGKAMGAEVRRWV